MDALSADSKAVILSMFFMFSISGSLHWIGCWRLRMPFQILAELPVVDGGSRHPAGVHASGQHLSGVLTP